MTWRRFLNRNQLQDGDATRWPIGWHPYVTDRPYVPEAFSEREREFMDQVNAERSELGGRLRVLAADLRRLERDAKDEMATARHIASRTGVDVEAVAAVLKEFFDW